MRVDVPSYVPPVYRPPSEARSLIFQITYGCSSDTCTFCRVYGTKRFRKRSEREVVEELHLAAKVHRGVRRIFFADGDALVLSTRLLVSYLDLLRKLFPQLERVTAYASPGNLLHKTPADLREIRQAGLEMVYVGIESGSDRILEMVRKGFTSAQITDALRKAKDAGFTTSSTVILGLGGPQMSEQHAVETGKVVTESSPDYVGALTLMLGDHNADFPASMYQGWRELTVEETLREVKLMLEHIECDECEFRANHASNWLALKGRLQPDRMSLVTFIDDVLEDPDSPYLRPDYFRAL